MKKALIICALLLVFLRIFAQDAQVEKLKQQIKQHPQQDTFRVKHLNSLGKIYFIPVAKLDSIDNEALLISRKINYLTGEGYALVNLAALKLQKGDKAGAVTILQ